MTEYILLNILTILFSTQIVRTYMDTFHNAGKSSRKWKSVTWGAYTIFQYVVMESNASQPLLILGVNILLVFLIYKSYYQISSRTALFLSAIFYSVWMLVEVATNDVLQLTEIEGYSYFFVVGNVVSKIVMYLFVHILKRYRKSNSLMETSFRYGIRLFLIPLATIYIIHNAYYITSENDNGTFFHITTVLMLLMNYITFDVYDRLGKQNATEKQNLAYEQQITLCNKQALERETTYQESRIVRHNLKDYLISLKSLLQNNRIMEAEAKIDDILELNQLYKKEVSRSGNLVIDSLINYKYSLAKREDITMKCYVFVPEELPFDGADLCVILGNLIENSMEAVNELPTEKRHIDVSVIQIKGSLSIKVQNPYAGKIRKRNGRMQTSKHDYKNHGIGLLSVQRTVAKYNGDILIHDTDGIFKVTILLYPPEKLHEEP